ncbi:MAG TPA: sortase [Candidatus Microsaccharimonas sp.]|jgi:LPXTG-site transpeptidase (sortase) family protein
MSHAVNKGVFYSVFGIINLVVGMTFYVVYLFHIAPPVMAVSEVTTPIVMKPKPIAATSGTPTRIVIPSIGVDVGVGVGSYNPSDGTWTLDNERAFYADASVPVNNNNGVTLIYGHARRAVFGRLGEVTDGSDATVYTDTGYSFHYIYESKQDVSPTDISILRDDGAPTLVLQTCSGPWDAYRTLVSFRLTGDQKT